MNWRSTTYIEIQNQLRAYFAAMYAADMNYLPTMICTHEGKWYVCLNATNGVFSVADWQLIPGPTTTQHGNYNPTRTYLFGDYCFYLGNLYICQGFSITGAFDAAQWLFVQSFRHLRWIDVFNNQYNYLEADELPFPLPAIFVEFHSTTWKNGVNQLQLGDCTIRIHVVLENYHESYHTSYDQAASLDRFDYLERVQFALQGFGGTYFLALQRTAEQLDSDHSNVMVHIFDYQTEICDDSLKPETERIEIEDVHVNPDYDNPVSNFDRLGIETPTAIANNPPPPPSGGNPYFVV